jgi:hypothetical protein
LSAALVVDVADLGGSLAATFAGVRLRALARCAFGVLWPAGVERGSGRV